MLDYTNLYIRFGLGRDFDPTHPRWQEYVAGLGDVEDRREWTYRFYGARPDPPPPGVVATSGCFSYAWLDSGRIRLHFHASDGDGRSPLGQECRDRRLADLTALFASLKHSAPTPSRVVGASWLYNLMAYRRLFPEPYLATAQVVRQRFRHMPLWGQFVNRHGDVRGDVAGQFRDRLRHHSSLQNLDDCFPFQVLALEAPVVEFYDFYGV